MEFEQVIKRLDWLDEEHRKDKNNIEELIQRVTSLEGDLKAANKKFRDLANQMSHVSNAAMQIEQVDSTLAQHRANLFKYIDDQEKKHQAEQAEMNKRSQLQFGNQDKAIEQINAFITKAKQERADQAEQETHRNNLFKDWEKNIQSMIKDVEGTQRWQKSLEESRRQDTKRLADLQADLDILTETS